MTQYIVYSKNNCPFCERTIKLLTLCKLNYTELKLDKDFTRDIFIKKFPNHKTFPMIVKLNDEIETNIGGSIEFVKHLKKLGAL